MLISQQGPKRSSLNLGTEEEEKAFWSRYFYLKKDSDFPIKSLAKSC